MVDFCIAIAIEKRLRTTFIYGARTLMVFNDVIRPRNILPNARYLIKQVSSKISGMGLIFRYIHLL